MCDIKSIKIKGKPTIVLIYVLINETRHNISATPIFRTINILEDFNGMILEDYTEKNLRITGKFYNYK